MALNISTDLKHEIGFSINKSDLQNNKENVSYVAQRKSFTKNKSEKRDNKNFQCDICSKRFERNVSLEIHERTHTGEKPFECITCKKTFSALVNLKRHDKIHVHR